MAMSPNKSEKDCLVWSPWKPHYFFLLLMLSCASISRTGCTCYMQNPNDTTLAFVNQESVKQHVISQGFQTISCKAANFCHIQWYMNKNRDPDHRGDPYPWHLGQFTVFSLEDANQTLQFQSADKNAEGFYTCVVSNGTHEINQTTLLKVDKTFWNGKPLQLQHELCRNQTAGAGQNMSFLCRFYVGAQPGRMNVYWLRPNKTLPEDEWSACGYGKEWLGISELRENARYTTYQAKNHLMDAKHVPNFGNKIPSMDTKLDVFNVSEEAYGIYCVIANNEGHWISVILMLSPSDEEAFVIPHYRELAGMVVGAVFVFIAFSFLLWKLVALDMKLWYHGHYGDDERKDGKMYDAYMLYNSNETDRQFVLKIIMPYFEKFGYNLFIPEIHTVPSNVYLDELSVAMGSSRRCIMLITPSFTASESSKYEVDLAADFMSSKLSKCIIPVFMGVSACSDSTPLYGSEPSLSSASSSSSPSSLTSSPPSSLSSQNDISISSTSEISQDALSSIRSSCSSGSSTSPVSLSSKLVTINFDLYPILGQLIKVLKPLKTTRKPNELSNYTQFLKRLRLRMPKPPGVIKNPTMHHEMMTVSHTQHLVDNEVLPEGAEDDMRIRMEVFPKVYPVVPNNDLQNAGIHMGAYPVVPNPGPAPATSFHNPFRSLSVDRDEESGSSWFGTF